MSCSVLVTDRAPALLVVLWRSRDTAKAVFEPIAPTAVSFPSSAMTTKAGLVAANTKRKAMEVTEYFIVMEYGGGAVRDNRSGRRSGEVCVCLVVQTKLDFVVLRRPRRAQSMLYPCIVVLDCTGEPKRLGRVKTF